MKEDVKQAIDLAYAAYGKVLGLRVRLADNDAAWSELSEAQNQLNVVINALLEAHGQQVLTETEVAPETKATS